MLLRTLYDRIRGNAILLPYEKICLNAWRDTLSLKSRHTLDTQLSRVRLTQRQAGGAKLCFYYPQDVGIPLFSPKTPDLHVATISLTENVKNDAKELNVKVFVHRGLFFSLEFPKRPSRFAEQHHMRLERLVVKKLSIQTELDP